MKYSILKADIKRQMPKSTANLSIFFSDMASPLSSLSCLCLHTWLCVLVIGHWAARGNTSFLLNCIYVFGKKSQPLWLWFKMWGQEEIWVYSVWFPLSTSLCFCLLLKSDFTLCTKALNEKYIPQQSRNAATIAQKYQSASLSSSNML